MKKKYKKKLGIWEKVTMVKITIPFFIFPLIIAFISISSAWRLENDTLNNERKNNKLVNVTKKYAFATVTTPAFCMGAVALAQSLIDHHGDKYDYLCLVTKDVNKQWRSVLSQWWRVVEVPEYKPGFTYRRSWIKLNLWTFTEYEKIVYLDTDTLVFAPLDELFDANELSCVADTEPPQICNTGVLVLTPSMKTYHDMVKKSKSPFMNKPPGDQGFINAYFGGFNPLPSVYNVPRIDTPGFSKYYRQNKIKVVHFVCKKPWKCGREGVSYCGCGEPELNKVWFQVFDKACQNHTCLETWKE